jgi:uncharacterized protein YraI
MLKLNARLLLSVLVILALALSNAPRADAGDAVTFTVIVKSAFLRSGPGLNSPRVYSVFLGQTFGVIGRNADSTWLRLDFPGASSEAWIMAQFGAVDGNLSAVPVTAASDAFAGATAPPPANTAPPAPSAPSATLPNVTFKVTIKSAFARSAPTLASIRAHSLFKGQTYKVLAQSADGQWLRLDVAGIRTEAWVPISYGTTTGPLAALPVAGALPTAAPPSAAPAGPVSFNTPAGVVPSVSARAREIYQYGLSIGNNPRAFSKVGDCQSVTPFFLAAFDNPSDYSLGQYAYVQDTINNFAGSWSRQGQAVSNGFTISSVLNPMWANPAACASGETPLACEFRLHRPSIVIVSMETWWVNWPADSYEQYLRQIVEFSIARGAVPILATKADNLEGDGSINAAIQRVARDYDVPLWNFWLAVQPLPGHGVLEDGFHLSWGRAMFDNPEDMQKSWTWRNLTALQSVDAVWKAVR